MKKKKQTAFDALISEITKCSDFRIAGRTDYPLNEILFLTICGSMADSTTYEQIYDFGIMRLDWLKKYLPYKNGIPSHDTINRVLSLLNPQEFGKLLTNWACYDLELSDGSIIALDGKWISKSATIKQQQTKKIDGGKQAILMVNAYCVNLNKCLTSICVEAKNVEKQAFESIVKLLDVSKCIVTIDAAGCYRDTVMNIRSNEAEYVIGLKKNQKLLYELTERLFANQKGKSSRNERDRGHGRIETRKCTVLTIKEIEKEYPSTIETFSSWKDLKSLIQIESSRKTISTGKEETFKRYYISSLTLSPTKMGKIVRDHWGIENGLHWVLDVIMGEDQSRKRNENAAANYSIIKKVALNNLNIHSDHTMPVILIQTMPLAVKNN